MKKIKLIPKLLFFTLLLMGLNSCDDVSNSIPDRDNNDDQDDQIGFVTHEKNLNVIYFVPNDNPEVEGYKERLSDLLIYFQDYVKSEMDRNGFGEKTFGLPVDDSTGLVKIITIQGNDDQYAYDYGSAEKIQDEIATYKAANSAEFSNSAHSLILLPEREDKGRQPFFGIGKTCFALDNPNIKVEEIEITSSNYIGGMLHELGHGLNLPHNHAKESEVEPLGTALMGSGNYTWGREPTFITEANCAVLNRNEIFQEESLLEYYEPATSSVDIGIDYEETNKAIHVYGTFTSDKDVSDVLFFMDPRVSKNDADYNSIAWRTDVIGVDSLDVRIPLNELEYTGNTPYELKVKLLMENGSINTETYNFDFVDGVPDFSNDRKAQFYQHCSYGGYEVELEVGSYTTAQIEAAGIVNNDVSGLKVPFGMKVILYDEDNFSGTSKEYTSSNSCITGFNDKTSSLRVQER